MNARRFLEPFPKNMKTLLRASRAQVRGKTLPRGKMPADRSNLGKINLLSANIATIKNHIFLSSLYIKRAKTKLHYNHKNVIHPRPSTFYIMKAKMKNLKTEHNGPKKGNGAYWGRKWEAKKLSNKTRRITSRQMKREYR